VGDPRPVGVDAPDTKVLSGSGWEQGSVHVPCDTRTEGIFIWRYATIAYHEGRWHVGTRRVTMGVTILCRSLPLKRLLMGA
jgi:hypothetical protein